MSKPHGGVAMARKNLLEGLMNQAAEASDTPAPPNRVDPAKPRYTGGAIGAVSQSIADLKSRSVVEIDTDLIDAGGLRDRIDETVAEHEALIESIRAYGQQVPILVRPHPETDGRYQIVYGRRRVAALREIGEPAKALIRDLDDSALIMAQGQENSARRDLSFIEKCNFARQMNEAGYDRKVICDALSVDKTLISRMFSVVSNVPVDLIEYIGSAPQVGRDRWIKFADAFATYAGDADDVIALIAVGAADGSSAQKFDAAIDVVTARQSAPPQKPKVQMKAAQIVSNGVEIGKATSKPKEVVLSLPRAGNDGFEDWLIDNLASIHRDWAKQRAE